MIMGLAGCASPARIDQMTADLLRVDQPKFGFNMTVSATAGYLIVEQATGNRQQATGNRHRDFFAQYSHVFHGQGVKCICWRRTTETGQ